MTIKTGENVLLVKAFIKNIATEENSEKLFLRIVKSGENNPQSAFDFANVIRMDTENLITMEVACNGVAQVEIICSLVENADKIADDYGSIYAQIEF